MKKIICISILTAIQLLAYEAGINADGSGVNATAIGDNSTATGLDSTATGEYAIATGNNSIAIGNNSNAAGNNSSAIGSFTNVDATTNYSIAIGTGSVVYATDYNTGLPLTNQDNVVSFGRTAENGSIGMEITRRLINISDPINAHDAVNLNYLNNNFYTKTYIDSINSSANTYADTQDTIMLNESKSYADTQDRAVLNESKSYTDNKINSLEQTLTKDIKTATATSIALGVSPILADGNKNAIGLGFGNYEGQSAAAINYIAEINKNTHVQLGSSLNATSKGFKAGVSYGF